MTVGFDTLDFEGGVEGAGYHAHGASSSMAPAPSGTHDDRPGNLAKLVETHRPWAIETARGLLARIGDVFELEAIKRVLGTRADIQSVIGAHGTTAHGALEQLILDCARALSPQVMVASPLISPRKPPARAVAEA